MRPRRVGTRTLLGAKGIATRSRTLLGAPGLTTRNKKLLGANIRDGTHQFYERSFAVSQDAVETWPGSACRRLRERAVQPGPNTGASYLAKTEDTETSNSIRFSDLLIYPERQQPLL